MKITLRQLAVFKAVYEKRRISLACRTLCLSAPAISQTVRDLEQDLGVTLFLRQSAGLVPTDEAEQLLPYANLMLEKVHQIEGLYSQQAQGLRGSLRVGANKTFGIYVLSRRLPVFKKRYPAVRMQLRVEANREIERLVAEQALDVGFISGAPTEPRLTGFPCFFDRRCLVASVTSLLCSPEATAQDYSMATWYLDDEEETLRDNYAWLSKRSIQVRDCIPMGTVGTVKRAVATGLGLSVLPYLAVVEEIRRGELVDLAVPEHEEPLDVAQCVHAVFREDTDSPMRTLFFKECGIAPLPMNSCA